MFLHYLKTALRNLRKNPLYSAINIVGLSSGIGICLLILVYVAHERSYDRFHRNADRIFSVRAALTFGDQVMQMNLVSNATGPAGKASSPHVQAFMRMFPVPSFPVQTPSGARNFEDKFAFADSNFFDFFSFPLLEGAPAVALARPFSVVLSQRAARKYFGRADPVGRTLLMGNGYPFTVTGVAKDPPSNSSIDFDFITPMSSAAAMADYKTYLNWQTPDMGGFHTWFLLDRKADTTIVANTLTKLSEGGPNAAYFKFHFYLDPLTASHLGKYFGETAAAKYVNIFPLVAGLILLLALINYMSLATARASVRAREIGVRKVIGAGRGSVAAQFYTESFLYALIAFSAGLGLFFLLRSWFAELMHAQIGLAFLRTPMVLGLGAVLFVITVVTAGSYPALLLSSFRPMDTLAGKLGNVRGGSLVRKFFTVLQFSISVTLIVFCWMVNRQLDYFRHIDGGLLRDRIVNVSTTEATTRHIQALRADIAGLSGVEQVGLASYPFYSGYVAFSVAIPGQKKQITVKNVVLDSTVFQEVGIRWAAPPRGTSWSGKPTLNFFNETAADRLGLFPDPVGKKVDLGTLTTVDAIVRDFPYQSPEDVISPLYLEVVQDTSSFWTKTPNGNAWLIIKLAPNAAVAPAVASIEKAFHRYDPDHPFQYKFMDEVYGNLFSAENRMAGLMDLFTALTVLIACLGLFGLATFTAARRTKEIGIRKVLGAGAGRIVGMLTRDFLGLVGVAILIACPLAGWCTHLWLESFAYKISLSAWVFAAAGLGTLGIALCTVGIQALRAARANPVNSLRTE